MCQKKNPPLFAIYRWPTNREWRIQGYWLYVMRPRNLLLAPASILISIISVLGNLLVALDTIPGLPNTWTMYSRVIYESYE